MAQTSLFKQLVANNLVLEEAPFPSELGMEAFLMDNPKVLAFEKCKDDFPKVIDCEISLQKKPTENHSRLDMLVQYAKYDFAVVELKNVPLRKEALRQLGSYLTAERQAEIIELIRTNTQKYGDEFEYLYAADELKKVQFTGILAGPSLSKELEDVLPTCDNQHLRKEVGNSWPDSVKEVKVITINRFRNEHTGDLFVLANKLEPQRPSNKNLSTYSFNNESGLRMGQLVRKVVAYYVANTSGVSLDKLRDAFPDKIQGGRFGVFKELSEADAENRQPDANGKTHLRYYTADYIELADHTKIATTNQWYQSESKNTIEAFIEQAGRLGLPAITKDTE